MSGDDATIASDRQGDLAASAVRVSAERYTLGDELARGGMGVVYRATDRVLAREVAVKVLKEGAAAATVRARRFFDEARITGQLQHPAIPPVYDLGTFPDGRSFLAMKLIEGETLEALLKRRADARDEHSRYVAVFEQICQAVAFAHARGIIHRDIKPANIMVGSFGEVQVMDWGLAKQLSTPQEQAPLGTGSAKPQLSPTPTSEDTTCDWTDNNDVRTTDGATRDGTVLGTPAYMPPEQAAGTIHRVDFRSDVFGLGAILAVILTGKPPFIAADGAAPRIAAAHGDLRGCFARLDASGADPELVTLCQGCLDPNPSARPPHGGAVADAVAALRAAAAERARQAELDLVRNAEQRKRRRTQFALAASLAGLLALAGFGAALASLWQQAERAKAAAVEAQGNAEQAELAAKVARQAEETARQAAETQRERFKVFDYGRTMEIAHQEFRENRTPMALKLLDKADPALRGWEWQYMQRIVDPSILTLKGHTTEVWRASFSPDGTKIVSAGGDGKVIIWDAKTGEQVLIFAGHGEKAVRAAVFDPSGKWVASGGDDQSVVMWDAQNGTEKFQCAGLGHSVASVAFSADGGRMVTSAGNTAKVWDAQTGTLLATLAGHTALVKCASFSPDGARIVTGGDYGLVKIWDSQSGTELRTCNGHRMAVWSARFSPDGARVLTSSDDQFVKVWDAETGNEVHTLKAHRDGVHSAEFSPNNERIVTASYDRSIRFWNAGSGKELYALRGHTFNIRDVAFSPDGKQIVTASGDHTVKTWDAVLNPESLLIFGGGMQQVDSVAFHPDGTRIVTGSRDGSARVWDARSGALLLTLVHGPEGSKDRVFVAIDTDGSRIVTGQGKTVRIWDAETGVKLRAIECAREVDHVAYSPDGKRIAYGTKDANATIVDAVSGKVLAVCRGDTEGGHNGPVASLKFSADGTKLVTGSSDKTAKIWDASTGHVLRTLTEHSHWIHSLDITADGARVVTGSWDGTAKLWDAATGAVLVTLESGDPVRGVCISPDGKRIVTTGGDDGSVKLWDAVTGAEMLMLKHSNRFYHVISAAFSPDGTRIVTGAFQGTAFVWDCRPFAVTRQEFKFAPPRRAEEFAPQSSSELNERAWLLAAGPDGARDGAAAVPLATRACELSEWKIPYYIDTLAAAHAEAGDFDKAVAAQQQALDIAKQAEQPNPALLSAYEQRLALYRERKPYRAPELAAPSR